MTESSNGSANMARFQASGKADAKARLLPRWRAKKQTHPNTIPPSPQTPRRRRHLNPVIENG